MKAARIHAYGHSDQIQVEDVSNPVPNVDEVLVRISAAGINPVDWKIREGFMARIAPRNLPFTLGQDFAGEVIALGKAVTDVEAGEEVYGFASGTYAEYAVVSPAMIAGKPITVDDATAATLPTPGLTALQIVTSIIRPQRDQRILIHGAAGGVGTIATQLCRWKGARVIANASRDDAGYLASLGVEQVIDYRSQRFEDEVRDLDGVIDLVGGDTLARSYQVLAPGGVLCTTVGRIDDQEARHRGIRATHIVMQKNAGDLAELARLVDEGVVLPRDPRVLPLDEARRAQDLNQTGHVSGIVIEALPHSHPTP